MYFCTGYNLTVRKCKILSHCDRVSVIVTGTGARAHGRAVGEAAARRGRSASRVAPLMDIDGGGATN